LRERIESNGCRCVYLAAGEDAAVAPEALDDALEAAQRDPSAPLTHVVHLWALTSTSRATFLRFKPRRNAAC
jgi:hypothetical protein